MSKSSSSYYYVGSKEALFDAVVTEGGAARPGPAPAAGPAQLDAIRRLLAPERPHRR